MIEKILIQNEWKIDACFWSKVTAVRQNTSRNFKIIWNKLFDELANIKVIIEDNHKVTLCTFAIFSKSLVVYSKLKFYNNNFTLIDVLDKPIKTIKHL